MKTIAAGVIAFIAGALVMSLSEIDLLNSLTDPAAPTDWKLVAVSGGAVALVTVMFLLALQGAGRAARRG